MALQGMYGETRPTNNINAVYANMTRDFSLSTKLTALLRYAVCADCGRGPLSKMEFHWDHIDPWNISKDRRPSNCQPLCADCHKRKTFGSKATTAGSDIGNAAKVKRLRGETGQNRVKKEIPSRGFDKTFKKKVTGEVERRT